MLLQINSNPRMPVYLQIVDQIYAAAASGMLRPGEALPPIRPLAEKLCINRNTVAKAYSELESLGVIETLSRRGCFLTRNPSPMSKDARRRLVVEEVDRAIVYAHNLGVPRAEFLGLIQARLVALDDKRRTCEGEKEAGGV
jgi:GntR family transcriptional regulator